MARADECPTTGVDSRYIARFLSEPCGTEYARSLSTERLKELWEKYDSDDILMQNAMISGEAIRLVLNERKEGISCSVS